MQRELLDPLCWVYTMELERRLGSGTKSEKQESLKVICNSQSDQNTKKRKELRPLKVREP